MPNTKWSDLNRDGRRLEGIIRDMNTKYWKCQDPDLAMSYADRIFKATELKARIIDRVLGVKKLLKEVNQEENIYV